MAVSTKKKIVAVLNPWSRLTSIRRQTFPGAIFTFLHELVKEESYVLVPAGVGERIVPQSVFLRRK